MLLSFKKLRGVAISGVRENQVCLSFFSGEQAGLEDRGSEGDLPNLLQLKEQHDLILAEAREKARQLSQKMIEEARGKARQEAEKIKKEAFARGYEEGLAKGKEEAEIIKASAQKLLEEARIKAREIVAAAEPEVIRMAVALAEKLLQRQLEENEESILPLLEKSLEELSGGREIRVKVPSQDLDFCRQRLEQIREKLKPGTHLELLADPSLKRGSCRVESEEGQVEISVQDNFAGLSEALLSLSRQRAEALQEGARQL